MEPIIEIVTRKTRAKKPSAPHIAALKQAVSKALRTEWLLQKARERLEKTLKQEAVKIAALSQEAREAWLVARDRSAECAGIHTV